MHGYAHLHTPSGLDGTLLKCLLIKSVVSQDVLRRRNSNGATETKTEKEKWSLRDTPLSYLTTMVVTSENLSLSRDVTGNDGANGQFDTTSCHVGSEPGVVATKELQKSDV